MYCGSYDWFHNYLYPTITVVKRIVIISRDMDLSVERRFSGAICWQRVHLCGFQGEISFEVVALTSESIDSDPYPCQENSRASCEFITQITRTLFLFKWTNIVILCSVSGWISIRFQLLFDKTLTSAHQKTQSNCLAKCRAEQIIGSVSRVFCVDLPPRRLHSSNVSWESIFLIFNQSIN